MREIPKTYEPSKFEKNIYEKWEKNKYFHAVIDKSKKPYTIVIPPPNITGQLHLGHALNNTLQDVLIRFRRMQGFCTLWLPGTDHASIATEAKIVETMANEGITKEDIGRDGFLERAWKWKETYGGRIVEQLKKLGCSCDWERERFTLDEGLSNAVKEVFIRLYKKGLIYKGRRIINWCPKCNTSISDAEVEYEEKEGNLWHIKYPVKNSSEYIVVATTRPETMLGDTAVAVNPSDERYIHLIGKTVILPLMEREIPIIADDYVEKEFGTGAVKITPAHDPNDHEVGLRHNLEEINIMHNDAILNENAGKYAGLDRYTARKKIIEDLEKLNLMIKIEKHTHSVGTCYRCGIVIEPMLKEQWFVKMKPLAKPAIDVVKEGKVKFVPERFSKIYFNWMENIQDWCISRQLWWGHRIPAYYCISCGHIMVENEMPDKCSQCGSTKIEQDPDTLDTWFSSALWPFSTLGWPENTEDLSYFYPTDVLVTGYDIIFFWVARMIFSAMEHMNKEPFKYVFLNGIVRDSQGRKMSKSLGNGVDPLDIIDKYGTDALRYSLLIGNSPGNDLRFSEEKVEAARNFANKIWNASRFLLMNFEEDIDFSKFDKNKLTFADKWILSRLNNLVAEVTNNLEHFELGIALQKIYEFIWDEFCDWYIEMVKPVLYDKLNPSRLEAQYVLNYVLINSLKLLHPYMPFITEAIFEHLIHDDNSIMISKWPTENNLFNYNEEVAEMTLIMDCIRNIRNIRAQMNVPQSKKINILFVTKNKNHENTLKKGLIYIEKLSGAGKIDIENDFINSQEDAASAIVEDIEIFIPLNELIDVKKEFERLSKELETVEKELERVESKLNNQGFMNKAPKHVVEEELQKKEKYTNMKTTIVERLNVLKGKI